MAKSMALAVLLSIFFSGIGLMYAGRVGLGVLFFIITVICAVGSILIFPAIIALVIWIINLIMTVKTVNEANGN